MRNRQTGVTFIGWLVLLLPMAVVLYAGIRLVPKYLVYTEVSRALTQLGQEFSGDSSVTAAALKLSLEKRFDIEGIEFPTVQDVAFTREDGVWIAEVHYQDGVPLFAGISLTVNFDKRVPVK